MEAKTTRLYDIAMTAGPDINVTKARSMRIKARRPPSLLMAKSARKLMSRTGGTDEDIKARVNKSSLEKTSAVARKLDCSTATSNHFLCTRRKPGHAPRN